jgi:hypothetical protein
VSHDFESFAIAGLRLQGIELEDGDLDVLKLLHAVLAPSIDALKAADLSSMAAELDLDPSRAPHEG